MNKLTILAAAALSVLAVSPAMAQGKMMSKKPMQKMGGMKKMATPAETMKGLSPAEMKVANAMPMSAKKTLMMGKMPMGKMSSMQKTVAMKMQKNAKMAMMKKPMGKM